MCCAASGHRVTALQERAIVKYVGYRQSNAQNAQPAQDSTAQDATAQQGELKQNTLQYVTKQSSAVLYSDELRQTAANGDEA